MKNEQKSFLLHTIQRYIWWETPDESIKHPDNVIARIMNIGILDDISMLVTLFSKDELLNILLAADIGEFNDRSWHFWHYYLTSCGVGAVPPIPRERKHHA